MALKIYKRGQGKNTRIWTNLGIGLIVGLGCWRLYEMLSGADVGLWFATMIPTAVFAIFAVGIFWLTNTAKVSDFLISAEGEMKKVSWSSKQELIVSTSAVIVVVILMACMLAATDFLFRLLFVKLGLF